MRRGIATIQNALVAIPCLQRLLLLLLVLLSAPGLRAQDVLTYHNDNARSGLNPAESILTPANVNSTQFGLLFTVSVDGLVDAQPLYASGVVLPNQAVHDVLIVATEHDSVFAFDAVDGALLWQASAVSAGETTSDNRGCSFITPEIGITSTPVIDRSSGPHGTVYVVAMSKDASGNYHQRLHALDLTTGSEEFGGPMEIQAQYPGTGANSSNGYVIFDPAQYMERPGLLLLNGVIYTAWSSHCDFPPYTGWLIGYDEHTLAQTTVLNITPNGSEGAIWQSGGGLAADSDGYIYFLDANGTFDTTLNAQGFPSQGDYANAFMKLSTAGGGLSVADYFTMWNTVYESDIDQDLGSGGAMVLPDMIDAQGNSRQLAVGAGKDGSIYLVDRNNMGKFNPNSDNIYQELDGAFSSGEWGSPAYFNGTLYYGGIFNYLRAFQFSSARLSSPTSWSAVVFTYPGATPSVSANGTQNGIVWATENTSPAVLHAYDPTNLANELYNTNQAPNQRDQFGNGNKFIAPMISHGRVYVGTTTGVGVFGLLPAGTYVAPTGLGFGSQVVGSTSTAQAVSVSNFSGSALDVTSITASGSFAQTNSCPSILVAGDRCAIYATFSPTAIGPLTGTLTITDNSNGVTGSTQTVNLSGTGTPAPLVITASSGSMTYGGTAPIITPGYSGFVNGDTAASLTTPPTCSTTATAHSPAGSYPSTCSGAVDGNYTISYVNGTVTDSAAALAITASSASMTYGGTAPTPTPGYSGFVNGDTSASLTTQPTCSTTATSRSAAGSYPSSCTGAVDSNYTISYVNGTVTDGAAALAITASSASMTYGVTAPTITPSYSGFVNGETAASLATPPTCSSTATAHSPAGSYPSICSGAVDSNYSFTYVAGNVTVNQVTPVITWPTPTPITYGTTLSSTQLNATASVPGTFVYSPATGATPGAGTDTLSVTFTPTDTTDNTLATQTVSLTVNKATPVITWATPAAISYGTTLSSTQLNATASVPGTFVYSPAAGTTPAGGTDTLSVAFTPTDTADYNTATATVTLAVADFIFTLPSGSSTASAGSSRSANVAPGQLATYTLSVGGEGGLSGAVAFTCTGAPSEATCTVSPNPLTVGNSATNITITVTTTAPSVSAPRSRPLPPAPPLSPGLRDLLMLALVLAAMAWLVRRRSQPGVRRWRSTVLLLASGLLLTLALARCGGGGPAPNPGTPAGTYTLTVTGSTSSGSGTVSHSVTLTLYVS